MRMLSVGNIVVDILARVPALPERGGDVLAASSGMSPGGSFNALVAAVRQGFPAAYAGGHGTGFFGDLIRAGLREQGIEALLDPDPDRDSGYDMALVDDGGERTFVTSFGAEAHLSTEALAGVIVESADLVQVSGYGLLETTNAAVLAPWISALDPRVRVLVDPGPLVSDIHPAVWSQVLERADWLSCNEREAMLLTGAADARAAIEALAMMGAGVLVRCGASGCLVAEVGNGHGHDHGRDRGRGHAQGRGAAPTITSVAAFETEVVDTNGAGDAHTGAFLAALASGATPVAAAVRANACAALAVARFGPATAPTLDEVREVVRSSGRTEEA